MKYINAEEAKDIAVNTLVPERMTHIFEFIHEAIKEGFCGCQFVFRLSHSELGYLEKKGYMATNYYIKHEREDRNVYTHSTIKW